MGCGASTVTTPMRQMVLLGGGECGKTTIFKQIQILYGTGFEATSMDWIFAIHRAPVRAVKVILQACRNREEYQISEGNKVQAPPSSPLCSLLALRRRSVCEGGGWPRRAAQRPAAASHEPAVWADGASASRGRACCTTLSTIHL